MTFDSSSTIAAIVLACIEAKSQNDNIRDIRIVPARDIDLANMATRKSKLPGVDVEYFSLTDPDSEGDVTRGTQAVEIKNGWFIVMDYWVR